MLYIDNAGTTDPRLNLALEEYVLRTVPSDEPILLFYINEPSVIIGRHQNTLEEIDPDYVKENGIYVVRRLSGGGAVYHDLGNLNFSFMTNGREDYHNFEKFTAPVIAVLNALGVPAQLHGKSDIFVDGKKISGNAQYATPQRMFSHGTLLFDTDIENMLKALNPRQVQIESRAVQSVRNFVTNVRPLLPEGMTIIDLRQAILEAIQAAEGINEYTFSADDWHNVRALSDVRYSTWQWNYGRSPKFNVQKSESFPSGKVDLRIDVADGRIRDLTIYGSFFAKRDLNELKRKLIDVTYDREALALALDGVDIAQYVGNIGREAFLDLLF